MLLCSPMHKVCLFSIYILFSDIFKASYIDIDKLVKIGTRRKSITEILQKFQHSTVFQPIVFLFGLSSFSFFLKVTYQKYMLIFFFHLDMFVVQTLHFIHFSLAKSFLNCCHIVVLIQCSCFLRNYYTNVKMKKKYCIK